MKTLQELIDNKEVIKFGINSGIYIIKDINTLDEIYTENLHGIKISSTEEPIISLKEYLNSVFSIVNNIYNWSHNLYETNDNKINDLLSKYKLSDNYCFMHYVKEYDDLYIVKNYNTNDILDNIKYLLSIKYDMIISFYKYDYMIFEIKCKNNDYNKLEKVISKIKDI